MDATIIRFFRKRYFHISYHRHMTGTDFFNIMNIHIYNLFYICTFACTRVYMGFVPENKLICIRNILVKYFVLSINDTH